MSVAAPARRLLVLAGVWPRVHGNREAANVITFEILGHLLRQPDWQVWFCLVGADAPGDAAATNADLRALIAGGLRVLDPVRVPTRSRRSRVARLVGMLRGDPAVMLPGAAARELVAQRAAACRADAVLTVWSEAATAAAAALAVEKFAYYGNPDHKIVEARARFEWERSAAGLRSAWRYAAGRFAASAVRRAHLSVMRRYAVVADVAANDAVFYAAHGVRGARYMRNMWPGAGAGDWRERRRSGEQLVPAKIVASVGNLSATGNTLGFDTLGRLVLPAMKRRLGPGTFELHLFGGQEPHPLVAAALQDSHVKLRGFVDDIDAEILSAPVFLVANNHSYFKVGHTRFLHAWSLGACVVAFRDSAEAMPEIVHGENALLASGPEELAELVARAVSDRGLRERLGEGGRDTLLRKFDPRTVCGELVAAIGGAP